MVFESPRKVLEHDAQSKLGTLCTFLKDWNMKSATCADENHCPLKSKLDTEYAQQFLCFSSNVGIAVFTEFQHSIIQGVSKKGRKI